MPLIEAACRSEVWSVSISTQPLPRRRGERGDRPSLRARASDRPQGRRPAVLRTPGPPSEIHECRCKLEAYQYRERSFVANQSQPRIRLLYHSEIALGPGKVELLEGIGRLGSIAAAGRQMQMSYRRAWLLIDTMNRCFREPLVEAKKGGLQGGGASITSFGLTVLGRYHRLEARAAREFDDLLAPSTKLPSRKHSRKHRRS